MSMQNGVHKSVNGLDGYNLSKIENIDVITKNHMLCFLGQVLHVKFHPKCKINNAEQYQDTEKTSTSNSILKKRNNQSSHAAPWQFFW